jgi:rod shape-determining protein MreC
MRNLILLFIRHGGFVTFIILEFLCMYLVINNNQKQKAIYLNSLSAATDAITEKADNISQFMNLSAVNDSLAKKNAELLAEAENAKFIKTILRDSVRSPETEQLFTFIESKVISNSINRHNNTLSINRGSEQGISPGMGVIGANQTGVVGIVKSTTKNFSRVMSILHQQSIISASIKRNGHFGSIIWKSNDPTTVNLIDVPKHANIVVRDTVQTSGFSTIFPEGIMIGVVDTFWVPPGSNFFEINVSLITDLNKIKYVYVVDNLMKDELEKIREEGNNE